MITQDINRDAVEELVASKFDAFTLIPSVGYWKGVRENSVIVELQTTREQLDGIRDLARSIKQLNKQEAVLIETYETEGELV